MANTAQDTLRKGPLETGDHFTKFEIRGLLGKGGHAWVYHGYDQFLDRHVAIKMIPNPAEPGRNLGERAKQEARILCKLQHPNIVHVIDAGATDSGIVYIVMEILQGRTLREVLHEFQRLTVSEVLAVGAQIADGVQAAHELNAIHRDLKPENVFLLKDNSLKVLDFGIAKFLGYGVATTQKDIIHGTMLYMSPEHLQGLSVTPRSDIYGLGTILYEALAGRPPCMINIEVPTMQALAYSQVYRMPPPLDELTGTVPRHVARTIQRMIAKNPADRFSSMTEVADQLRSNWQRYKDETREPVPPSRELWRTDLASPSASVTRITHATTEIHELAPSSAMSGGAARVAQGGDTSPIAQLPFSGESRRHAPSSSAASTLLSVPNGASTLAAAPGTVGSRFGSTVPAVPDAKNKADPLRALPSTPPLDPGSLPPEKASSRDGQTRAARRSTSAVWTVVGAAVGVGISAGLLIGVVEQTRHQNRPSPASSSAEEPIVVLSAAAPVVAPAAPGAPVAIGTSASVQSQAAPVAVPPPPASPIDTARQALAPPIQTRAPTIKPTPKPIASTKMPASGLWDMSNLDTPAKPKPGPTSAPKPRAKALFGADDIK